MRMSENVWYFTFYYIYSAPVNEHQWRELCYVIHHTETRNASAANSVTIIWPRKAFQIINGILSVSRRWRLGFRKLCSHHVLVWGLSAHAQRILRRISWSQWSLSLSLWSARERMSFEMLFCFNNMKSFTLIRHPYQNNDCDSVREQSLTIC